MPDVGTLYLQVESNANGAASSLESLATALGSVKGKAAGGFGLETVRKELLSFTKSINAAKTSSTVFQNISAFGKGLVDVAKVIRSSQDGFDTSNIVSAIENIKSAVDGGMNLGQAGTQIKNIREALIGEWRTDNAYQAGMALAAIGEGAKSLTGTSLGTKAKEISALAKALSEYADASAKVKDVLGSSSSIPKSTGKGMRIRGVDDEGNPIERYMGLQFFGGKKGSSKSEGQVQMDLDNLIETTQEVIRQNTEHFENVGSDIAEKIAVGIEKSKDRVLQGTGVLADTIKREIYSKLNLMDLTTSPVEKLNDIFKEGATNIRYYGSAIDAALPKVQALSSAEMIDAMNERYASMSAKEQKLLAAELNGDIKHAGYVSQFTPELQEVKENVERLNIALRETGDIIESVIIPRFQEMYMLWSQWAYEFNAFKMESARLMSGESPMLLGAGQTPLLLGAGSVAPENMLSTWVQAGEQFKTDWVMFTSEAAEQWRAMWSPDWILGGWKVPQSMSTFHLGAGNSPLLLGAGGVAPENMLSTRVDYSKQYKPDWVIDDMSEEERADKRFQQLLWENAQRSSMAEQIRTQQEANFYGNDYNISNATETQAGIENTNRYTEAMEKLKDAIWFVKDAFDGVGGGVKKLFKPLTSLLKRFGQIAKYRMLRSVLKHITAGFTEGVQNVYMYSKAVGTDLAPAMDQAATALQQMKNSIGAAVAPVIQALVPVLQNVVNWFISLVNYVNQFFALINGQNTWTRALPEAAEAYEKNAKSAKDASKATKDLLADWDELNIIQSDSSNGSGSSTKKTAEEYANMFEEVNKFDHGVKDLIEFINKNLGGIPGILKKAAAILLGWKFSKAFSGFLGALGSFVAGGAMITLGVELSYGAGYEAGTKGYFDGKEIIESIVGGLAAAIGGSLITTALGVGGAVGFGIGIVVAAVATLVGWVEGQKELADINKWGNVHWTAQELEDFVTGQFSFDIISHINVINSNIDNMQIATENANAEIDKFKTSLHDASVNVSLGVDADPEGTTVGDAITAAQNALRAVETRMNAMNEGIEVGLKYLPYVGANGEDQSEDFLNGIMVAEKPIREYMRTMGEELADAMLKGEQEKWQNGTEEAAIKLMQTQQEIYEKAEKYAREYKFTSSLEQAMDGVENNGVIDKETAMAAMARQKELIDEFTKTELAEAQAEAVQLMYYAKLAYEMSDKAFAAGKVEQGSDLLNSAKELEEKAKSRVSEAENGIEVVLKESKENIAKMWEELYQTIYGEDINPNPSWEKPAWDLLGLTYDSPGSLRKVNEIINGNGLTYNSPEFDKESAAEELRQSLIELLQNSDPNGIIEYTLNDLGGSIENFLPQQVKEGYLAALTEITNDPTLANELMEMAIHSKNGIENTIGSKLKQYEVEAGIIVEIDGVESVIDERVFNQLQKDVEDAIADTHISLDEKNKLIDTYGESLYKYMVNYLNLSLDEEGYEKGHVPKGLGQIASNSSSFRFARGEAKSYVNTGNNAYTGYQGETTVATTSANNQQDIDNTARGTEAGTRNLLDALNSILRVAEAINRKEFTVNVSPSSAWGNHNARSQEAYDKVTG